MAQKVKKLEDIEEEFKKIGKDLVANAVLLDTGALIDIQKMIQRYRRTKKRNVSEYLEGLKGGLRFLICPEVFGEIEIHGRAKLNGYEMELGPDALGISKIYERDFSKEVYPSISFDQYGAQAMQNWLAVHQHLCNEIKDLCRGEPSATDLSLLTHATHLSTIPRCEVLLYDKIFVLTSDNHVRRGILELSKLGYNLGVISTRDNNGG